MITLEQINETYVISFYNVSRFDVLICNTVKKQILQLIESKNTRVLIDLKGIRFIDSNGFKAFETITRQVQRKKAVLRYCSLSDDVKELINLMQVFDAFTVCNREEFIAEKKPVKERMFAF